MVSILTKYSKRRHDVLKLLGSLLAAATSVSAQLRHCPPNIEHMKANIPGGSANGGIYLAPCLVQGEEKVQISYASEVPIYGFQFQLLCDGEAIEFSRAIENEGEAKNSGMSIYEGYESGVVLGFSFSGGHIDAREGELMALGLKSETSDTFSACQTICFYGPETVISGMNAKALAAAWPSCDEVQQSPPQIVAGFPPPALSRPPAQPLHIEPAEPPSSDHMPPSPLYSHEPMSPPVEAYHPPSSTGSVTPPPTTKETNAPLDSPPPSHSNVNSSTDSAQDTNPDPDNDRNDDKSTAIFVPLSIGLALLTVTVLYVSYRHIKRSNEEDSRYLSLGEKDQSKSYIELKACTQKNSSKPPPEFV